MSEPRETAETIEEVVPGVFHWWIPDSRIGGMVSSSHAVVGGAELVLIDPVPLAHELLATLPHPTAILLTATCHQRASWRYRRELGAEVWLPEGAPEAESVPDRRCADGDLLPGGLRAWSTPGPQGVHCAFVLERDAGVVFCSDILLNVAERDLCFLPPELLADPAEARRSVEALLERPLTTLCLDHGAPITEDPRRAVEELLAACS